MNYEDTKYWGELMDLLNKFKLPFSDMMLDIVPPQKGIYVFWDNTGDVLYIGVAESSEGLKKEIDLHKNANHFMEIKNISNFQIQVCLNPRDHQGRLLNDFVEHFGELPRYNRTTVDNSE